MITLTGNDRGLFASDIHLDDQDPATARLFFDMLGREAPDVTHLFLLGDLFEAWIGDDDDSAVGQHLLQVLARLSDAGVHVFLMRGNRDFLLDVPRPGRAGHQDASADAPACYSAQAGATMLTDPCRIKLFGVRTLLSHGDFLCTDDTRYQAFRAQSRTGSWQQAFLEQPLAVRQASARAMREQSQREKIGKLEALMDVNTQAVRNAMRDADAMQMIHGHTHRPAVHRDPAGAGTLRWVLPDWDARSGRAGMLLALAGEMRQLGNWN
jgi:UDP-2,3-diacylglucosamine hydrolase